MVCVQVVATVQLAYEEWCLFVCLDEILQRRELTLNPFLYFTLPQRKTPRVTPAFSVIGVYIQSAVFLERRKS